MAETIGVIVAGGKGQRLESLSNLPKALKQLAGFVLLQHTVLRFVRAGVDTIYILARYNVPAFVKCVAQINRAFHIAVRVIQLDEGTYVDSPISDIVRCLRAELLEDCDNLFVSYCDVVTDFDLGCLLDLHREKHCLATLLLFSGNKNLFVHKYVLEESGVVSSISAERSDASSELYANGGIYLLRRSLLDGYAYDSKIHFSEQGGPIEKAFMSGSLFGISPCSSYFQEIGTPKDFLQCEQDLLASEQLRGRIFG